MKKDDEVKELFDEPKKPIEKPMEKSNNEENKTLSLEDVANVLEKSEDDKPKRKRRSGGKGRKSNAQIEAEKKAEETKTILRVSFGYALVGLTSALSQLLNAEKWSITDKEESEYLAGACIQYLDERFPDWEQSSPELNLAMAWSTYFVRRLVWKPSHEVKDFNKVPGTKENK